MMSLPAYLPLPPPITHSRHVQFHPGMSQKPLCRGHFLRFFRLDPSGASADEDLAAYLLANGLLILPSAPFKHVGQSIPRRRGSRSMRIPSCWDWYYIATLVAAL